MQVVETIQGVQVRGLAHFSLAETLDCGQAFRFSLREGCWQGIAQGMQARLLQREDGLILAGCSREAFERQWRRYFDLDRDYEAIRQDFLKDPALAVCARYAPGIRILRQEAWETLISFIISQNNHVPRIKGIIDRLCALFGEPVDGGYAFPTAQRLAELDEQALAPLRAGWRSSYILDAARRVADGRLPLDQVADLPLVQAREALMTVRGVGPKVAECVLLYGMGRFEAFPLDVWMKRAMSLLFPGRTPADFGPYAGIAQQYIFHYSRMQKIG